MSRAGLILLACVLGACGTDPCDGVAGACLAVHVESATVRQVDQLDFDIAFGASHGMSTSRAPGGRATSLPVAIAIELGTLTASSEMVRLGLTGELGGAIVGSGTGATTVHAGEHATLRVQLGSGGGPGGHDLAIADASGGCTVNGLYCGGDKLTGDGNTLYRCNGAAAPTVRGVCQHGCLVRVGRDDECSGGGAPCVASSLYCGGDKVDGDPQTLYRCQATGAPTVMMLCPNGCQVLTGQNDACR